MIDLFLDAPNQSELQRSDQLTTIDLTGQTMQFEHRSIMRGDNHRRDFARHKIGAKRIAHLSELDGALDRLLHGDVEFPYLLR